MRFSAPRSLSPSPIRGKVRSRSTFGLQSSDSEDDDELNYYSRSISYSDSDSYSSDSEASSSSSSTDSFCYATDSDIPRAPKLKSRVKDSVEQRHIEDTVAAIRLRIRHCDPYEEWQKQTRKDAFRTARKELTAAQVRLRDERAQTQITEAQRIATQNERQMAEVHAQLESMRLKQRDDENRLREGWKARDRKIWERIESVIKLEEYKVKARLDAEQKAREEEERARNEANLRRQLLEEKKRQEEAAIKRREEEEQRLKEIQKKKEEDEEAQRLEDEKLKTERQQAEEAQRRELGITTSNEDWIQARANLHRLKTDTMKLVKSDKAAKSEWGKWRRQITSKIGQITNDGRAIIQISTQLVHIVSPPSRPHHQAIYTALLSSLAKAILLQAETEVTAEKRSAIPLAQVAFNLLDTVEGFSDIFFAKIVQRVGGWPIPTAIPPVDHDGKPWKDESDRIRAMGYRKSQVSEDIESAAEYTMRIAGIMRVYFHILKIPPREKPLHTMFQIPRYWVWVARLMGERGLLETAVAPQLLYTALDVMGSHARELWGHQWNKMLELIYEGVTVGFGSDRFIGGASAEGKAARVRVQLEVERIITGVS